jgi:hypothetical protein
VGVKYTYRIQEGSSGGWFASLRTTTGGKWVNVAGPVRDDRGGAASCAGGPRAARSG